MNGAIFFILRGGDLGSPTTYYNWNPNIRQFRISKECIKSIYLGYKFFSPRREGECLTQEEEMIVEYLIEHKDKVKAYQIVAVPNEFRYEHYETEFFLRNGVYYARDWKNDFAIIGNKSHSFRILKILSTLLTRI